MRYPQIYDGQIQFPVMSPGIFRHQCCDCGLVHDVAIDVLEGTERVLWSWTRNNRATGQVRRHKRDADAS